MEIKIQEKIKIKSVRIPSNESDLWFRVLYLVREGRGRVGKINMGDYRMK